MQNLVMLSLVLSTVYTQDTGYGGEQRFLPRSTYQNCLCTGNKIEQTTVKTTCKKEFDDPDSAAQKVFKKLFRKKKNKSNILYEDFIK